MLYLKLLLLGFSLAATPGPDFFLILRNTLVCGRGIGYLTLLGNRLSLCIHICLSVLGITAILSTSSLAYFSLRLFGALYLIYLGVKNLKSKMFSKNENSKELKSEIISASEAIRRGFLNNLLNPKVSLFFLSLFPQFVRPEDASASPLLVGFVFFIGNSLWWIPLVLVLGYEGVRKYLNNFQYILDTLFGVLFVGFGIKILFEVI
jgi:threonine/homoserine/homoserine lactone efflux protein